jgi:hypothetical protein
VVMGGTERVEVFGRVEKSGRRESRSDRRRSSLQVESVHGSRTVQGAGDSEWTESKTEWVVEAARN